MKYFVFAIDDGTICDEKVSQIFDKFGIRATFNLNTGLQDFVWYKDDKPVRRLNLNKYKNIYKNHEVSSHSLTHPWLTSLSDEDALQEVKSDVDNLERIFQREVISFSFPFEGFDEHTIGLVKSVGVKNIILPEIDSSFLFPTDSFHIKVSSWNIDDALNKLDDFINNKDAELFVFLSHSYDYEFDNSYKKLERLCDILTKENNIGIVTIKDLGEILRKI